MTTAAAGSAGSIDTLHAPDGGRRRSAMWWAGLATTTAGLLATAALVVEWAVAQTLGRAAYGLTRGLAGGWATTDPDELPSAASTLTDLLTTTTVATVLAVAAAVALASRLGRSVTMPPWANGLTAAALCSGAELVVLAQVTGGFPG
ncbi:hypothetical protein RKE38_07125 [Phycicoccus sp. M110.8]|uniref:hypothetical protein n=1 Tax=Phycicoccus sp. M110.8 TaxID=3075433 RepID=UPI0028FDAE82|nr:hypothetical protein [Phycicoccus sp. M110.8]MDU0313453.1 hypothetical protein [Phycicoccus sp. M110.8]